ncbi:AP-3 complex subunit delta [Malassezia nana]|uniref:AP-3 complex subunit delta n=1 Tax=Malassezia nana TaxID=180528 RepID=A0AAF0EJ66_9BASI|nr:AP-3 complex subunit delta [Malassezia nana]
MFEKSLSALIKGLRSHRGKDEAKYVASMLEEIRSEIKSGDMEIKAEAVLKLAYLQMLGYRVASASFHILETMASSKYHTKHIGYLAATLCFAEDTEVLILATNLIKKDLNSALPLDVLEALHGLSHLITQELAQHIADDILRMLTHSRPLVRKRAVLVLHSAIMKCPEILDRAWERLRDLLCDEDLGVVTATVNMICELARRRPAPFVPLSPQLFQILTTTSNNWLLIKVIKLFGALAPIEPRLVRKLLKPISDIITTTPAMSVLYECIHTSIIGGMLQGAGSDELAQKCVENLGRFLQDADQNLRYIALVALGKVVPTHTHLVTQHQDTILQSIWHPDLTIRLRALDLACHLATDAASLHHIVGVLLTYLEEMDLSNMTQNASQALKAALDADDATVTEPASVPQLSISTTTTFRAQVAESILDLGGADNYALVPDAVWYMNVLVRLAPLVDTTVVTRVVDQLTDIVFLHPSAQQRACERLQALLLDETQYEPNKSTSELLRAGAAICSEFVEYVDSVPPLVRALVQDRLSNLPPRSIAILIHSALKLYAYWAATLSPQWSDQCKAELEELTNFVMAQLGRLAKHEDSDVHERAQQGLQLFVLIQNSLGATGEDSQPQDSSSSWTAPLATEQGGPRALHLLLPLFYTRAKDAEAPAASLPKQMDLHAWISSENSWKKVLRIVEPVSASGTSSASTRTTSHPRKARETRKSVREEKQDTVSRPISSHHRRDEDSPFYLPSHSRTSRSKKSSRSKTNGQAGAEAGQTTNMPSMPNDNVDDVPIVKLDLSDFTGESPLDTPAAGPMLQPKLVAHKKRSQHK